MKKYFSFYLYEWIIMAFVFGNIVVRTLLTYCV